MLQGNQFHKYFVTDCRVRIQKHVARYLKLLEKYIKDFIV